MTNKICRIESRNTSPSTFGGIISDYDFTGYKSMRDIASRIISDRKFDAQCRRNIEQRNKRKLYRKGKEKHE